MIDYIAKQLVENKTEDCVELFNILTDFDKYCLNKFYNMNFKTVNIYQDYFLWFRSSVKGYVKICKYLIDTGININMTEHTGDSALTNASDYDNVEIVKLLLKQPSIEVNLQNNCNSSALILASYKGDVEIVKLLLKHPKININLQNRYKSSALILASIDCNVEVVKLLLQHKDIDTTLKDVDGKTALDLTTSDEIIELIENHGR